MNCGNVHMCHEAGGGGASDPELGCLGGRSTGFWLIVMQDDDVDLWGDPSQPTVIGDESGGLVEQGRGHVQRIGRSKIVAGPQLGGAAGQIAGDVRERQVGKVDQQRFALFREQLSVFNGDSQVERSQNRQVVFEQVLCTGAPRPGGSPARGEPSIP